MRCRLERFKCIGCSLGIFREPCRASCLNSKSSEERVVYKTAELNGNVDSENNHGGSSRTYVLHRTGCSQEDDQLLRQGCERSGSPGRPDRSNTLPTPAGAPDGADEESDLRSADGN